MKAKKSSIKWIVTGVSVFMALLMALVLIGKATNGKFTDFKNASLRKVNEDNLYQDVVFATDDDYEDYIANALGDDGYQVAINKDHVLTVSGATAEDAGNTTVLIGTYTLEANKTYIFDSSLGSNGSRGTLYMRIVNGETLLAESMNTAKVIAPAAADRDVSIYLVLAENNNFNSLVLRPILCVGEKPVDAVSFYVNK